MSISWYFHAVRARNAFGFRWYWQKRGTGAAPSQQSTPFNYYYDCIEDARKHGFRGPLPAGPKVARARLPELPLVRPPPLSFTIQPLAEVPKRDALPDPQETLM
ncbi:MAG: hypothetical protein ACXWIS_12805 [Burkholderiales bacterium]